MAEHGSTSRYVSGCRCDECRAANTAHVRAWRERKSGLTADLHSDELLQLAAEIEASARGLKEIGRKWDAEKILEVVVELRRCALG